MSDALVMMIPNVEILPLVLIVFLSLFVLQGGAEQSSFEDVRCRCVCPRTNATLPLHIKLVEPNDCTCKKVVGASDDICHLCDCKYESRNTTTIKVVVIFIICVVSLLFVYMVFLLCLDPFLQHRPAHYSRQRDDEVMMDMTSFQSSSQMESDSDRARQRTLLNRVTDEQRKWKGTVQEQRKNIYDRHNMLN